MAQIQPPITIMNAMEHINKNEYLLPAFQREFVWKSEQIEKLFDSLMCGYPTSSMLFWKVQGSTKTKWKFYEFINKFVLDAKDYTITNKFHNTSNSNDFYAILDGQQRLTALRIGIFGTYSYHEPRKSWEYSANSFPSRTLYLNISRTGFTDDDCKYLFKFLKDEITGCKPVFIDINSCYWLKVGEVINYYKSGDDAGDYFVDYNFTREQKHIINTLKNTLYQVPNITYFEEDEQNPDKAVTIFTRINSGGTYLSFPDIVFSLMVANWETLDARTQIEDLITIIGQKGFEIDKSYIVKAFLYLYHRSVKTEINSFSKDFCKIIENNWIKISTAIQSLFDLLRSFGLTSFSLTSNNATLPILYYIYHGNKYDAFKDKVEYENDRAEIKRWLFSAILRKSFGGTSDATLQQTRKAFTNDIDASYIDLTKSFSFNDINKNINAFAPADDELLNDLLLTQKDNRYAFPILSLLYPNLDYKNNDFHKDHIHPESAYKKLPATIQEKIPFKKYNSILNLEMLCSNENESKNNQPLKDWINNKFPNTNDPARKLFLNNHLIPDIDLDISNLEAFMEEREKLLRSKLKSIL